MLVIIIGSVSINPGNINVSALTKPIIAIKLIGGPELIRIRVKGTAEK